MHLNGILLLLLFPSLTLGQTCETNEIHKNFALDLNTTHTAENEVLVELVASLENQNKKDCIEACCSARNLEGCSIAEFDRGNGMCLLFRSNCTLSTKTCPLKELKGKSLTFIGNSFQDTSTTANTDQVDSSTMSQVSNSETEGNESASNVENDTNAPRESVVSNNTASDETNTTVTKELGVSEPYIQPSHSSSKSIENEVNTTQNSVNQAINQPEESSDTNTATEFTKPETEAITSVAPSVNTSNITTNSVLAAVSAVPEVSNQTFTIAAEVVEKPEDKPSVSKGSADNSTSISVAKPTPNTINSTVTNEKPKMNSNKTDNNTATYDLPNEEINTPKINITTEIPNDKMQNQGMNFTTERTQTATSKTANATGRPTSSKSTTMGNITAVKISNNSLAAAENNITAVKPLNGLLPTRDNITTANASTDTGLLPTRDNITTANAPADTMAPTEGNLTSIESSNNSLVVTEKNITAVKPLNGSLDTGDKLTTAKAPTGSMATTEGNLTSVEASNNSLATTGGNITEVKASNHSLAAIEGNLTTVDTSNNSLAITVGNLTTVNASKESLTIASGNSTTMNSLVKTTEGPKITTTKMNAKGKHLTTTINPVTQESASSPEGNAATAAENTTATPQHRFHYPHFESPESAAVSGALIAALSFGVIFSFSVLVLVGKRCFDSWQRRHYSKLDYLINGMYN